MTKNRNRNMQPLDLDEVIQEDQQQKERYSNLRFFLELVPIFLLTAGVLMRHQGIFLWKYAVIAGGLLAALIYLLFASFLLRPAKAKRFERILSVASGIVLALGITGLVFHFMYWEGAAVMTRTAIKAGLFMVVVTAVSFVFHLKDDSAAKFHRSLLARLFIFTALVYSLSF